MITKVNETHLKILSLFTDGYDREYYIREVEKLLKISSRTSLLILGSLENRGILKSSTRGKIKTYALRPSATAKEYFILAETYKKITLFEKNPLIKEIAEKIYPNINGIAMIFGSYAKGTEKPDSDLDIFIAGECDSEKIDNISKTYNLEINTKIYTFETFKNNIRKDILIKEVLKSHIMLKGTEQFLDEVIGWIR